MANPSFDELMHYGMKRRSGRFPWGSGENPYQHEDWYKFIKDVYQKREDNFTFKDEKTGEILKGDVAIARSMGLTTTQFRTRLALANNQGRKREVEEAKRLRAEDSPSLWDQKSDTQVQATRRLRDLISPQLFSLTYSCCTMLTNPYPVQV